MLTNHRSRTSMLALLATAIAALSTTAAAFASGPAPRWATTVAPSPTNLVPGSPATQRERLTVDATGGTFAIAIAIANSTARTEEISFDATASEVQAAINSALERFYNSVTVTGGPGGSSPYSIEWTGNRDNSLSGRGIAGVSVDSSRLTGASATAKLATEVAGVPAGELVIRATNVGAASSHGTITMTDALPAGLAATEVSATDLYREHVPLTCSTSPTVSCSYEGEVDTGDSLELYVTLTVAEGLPSTVANQLSVTGGGAAPVEVDSSIAISAAVAPFGVSPGSLVAALSTSQAGAHPDVTASFTVNTKERHEPVDTPKDVHFDLPRGLVGDAVGMPRCSMHDIMLLGNFEQLCPVGSMVGVATVTIREATFVTPVYNLPPAPGEPVAFGFDALLVPVRLDTTVLSNGDSRARVIASDLNEAEPVVASTITIWGVPADHNGPGPDQAFGVSFGSPSSYPRVPLLSNPQQCSQPLDASMQVDPWGAPGTFVASESVSLGTLSGCDQLRFAGSFSMLPDTLEAGAPAGYHFDLSIPQNNSPDGLSTPNVNNVKLTLPLGAVVNPAAAWGLRACSNGQFYGPDHPSQEPASIANCPREAQVGTVRIKTPALEEGLEGQVYLAEPECDPCTAADAESGKMVRLFVQAVSEGEGGIVVKLEGHGKIDQRTGQITTIFEDNPQLPFSEFALKLTGGPRAVLANPRSCGEATSNIDLTAWSSPLTPDLTPTSSFVINQGCFGPQFDPVLSTGSQNLQAGAYSPFTLTFGRSDQDQYLDGLSLHTPPGLAGMIGAVPLCKEPQAAQGTCDASSLIGHVQVLTGPGTNPFLVAGGQVFLTESYDGAPFGLSIVVPAVAGPYTLAGNTGRGTEVVRAKIAVDPTDAHLTVTSDPLPTILDGIPLQLKTVDVTIDRPQFMFNPTNCTRMAIGATLSSNEGMSSSTSRSYQVTNCAALGFKPKFEVSTQAQTSRARGASLNVKLTYPPGPHGTQADIAKVKVALPAQLPSQLKTLQKACLAKVFEANPANCPPASAIGHATVHTPVLPVALSGPAYFVSHGGEAFPSLTIVLQGYGVTIDLVGSTLIRNGITTTTFKKVPDVPFSDFELTLPQGPYAVLGANLPADAKGSFCGQKLVMPTEFVAQNGMEIKQSTPISVTGCPNAISLAGKRLTGNTLTLQVFVPAAGKLSASGMGLTRVSKSSTGSETLTLKLKIKRKGHFRSRLKLSFASKSGKRMGKIVGVGV